MRSDLAEENPLKLKSTWITNSTRIFVWLLKRTFPRGEALQETKYIIIISPSLSGHSACNIFKICFEFKVVWYQTENWFKTNLKLLINQFKNRMNKHWKDYSMQYNLIWYTSKLKMIGLEDKYLLFKKKTFILKLQWRARSECNFFYFHYIFLFIFDFCKFQLKNKLKIDFGHFYTVLKWK